MKYNIYFLSKSLPNFNFILLQNILIAINAPASPPIINCIRAVPVAGSIYNRNSGDII
jgi:hypothetical protein